MNELPTRIFEVYRTQSGKEPFFLWMSDLKDIQGRIKIKTGLNRLALGNFNNCNAIHSGVFELKINFGPGYRIYFGQESQRIILLLCGGNKQSQTKDIEKAKSYWEDYKCRSKLNSPLPTKTTSSSL